MTKPQARTLIRANKGETRMKKTDLRGKHGRQAMFRKKLNRNKAVYLKLSKEEHNLFETTRKATRLSQADFILYLLKNHSKDLTFL